MGNGAIDFMFMLVHLLWHLSCFLVHSLSSRVHTSRECLSMFRCQGTFSHKSIKRKVVNLIVAFKPWPVNPWPLKSI